MTAPDPSGLQASKISLLAPLLIASAGVAILVTLAPDYLFQQGFPLDDAWIHAVYAREFARTWTLAYNPGIPATGETAPLWPILLAWTHLVASSARGAVLLTKFTGLFLHIAASIVFGLGLSQLLRSRPLAWSAAAALALHPDFLAASVSGMEVPLAELVIAAAVWASRASRWLDFIALGILAVGARPEIVVICAAFPLLLQLRAAPLVGLKQALAATTGGTLGLVLLGIRNSAVSGLPLPATFYAKVTKASLHGLATSQWMGFSQLLHHIPLLGPSSLLALAFLGCLVLLVRAHDAGARVAAALFLSGILFLVTSFALVAPTDPSAFYHQRYALPGAMMIVGALPLLLDRVLNRLGLPRRRTLFALLMCMFVGVLLAATPPRLRRLSNDARNIDDVQVAMGLALAKSRPADTAWVIDAGAVRFFGRPFVVDMIGLNSPSLLTGAAQAFLDSHPPRFLDVFPGWSAIETQNRLSLPSHTFQTTTPYTVTSYPAMRKHTLARCESPGLSAYFTVRGRTFSFRCQR